MEVELLGTSHSHHGIEDGELTSGESTNHDATSTETVDAELLEASFTSEVDEAGHGGAGATSVGALVDEGQEGISRVRDDGSGNTSNNTRSEGGEELGTFGGGLEVDVGGGADGFLGLALNGELGHGVGDLLEEDGDEAGVETLDETIGGDNLGHGGDEAGGELGVGDEADTGGFEGAQEEIGDELSGSGGTEVDEGAVSPSGFFTHASGGVDLEEFDTTELEEALEHVAGSSGADTSGEGTDTFFGNDLLEATDHTLVVLLGLELHASLDDVDGADCRVSDGAADATSETTLEVVGKVIFRPVSSSTAHFLRDVFFKNSF
jgi:hypothetical protein